MLVSCVRHDDVIKWKHFPSPVNSPHKGRWRGALMFSLICVWINGWVNNGEAGDLRRYRAHYDVTLMVFMCCGVCHCVRFSHELEHEHYKLSVMSVRPSYNWKKLENKTYSTAEDVDIIKKKQKLLNAHDLYTGYKQPIYPSLPHIRDSDLDRHCYKNDLGRRSRAA